MGLSDIDASVNFRIRVKVPYDQMSQWRITGNKGCKEHKILVLNEDKV